MKKICFITTVSITINAFILKTAEYLHTNTDWDISFICSNDEEFAHNLPSYFHYYPVHMERGVSLSGIKAMFEMMKIFRRERFDCIQYSTPNASLYASMAGKIVGIPVRIYCQWGMAFKGMSGIKRSVFKTMEKIICKWSTTIEPDSKSNLNFAHEQKIYPDNVGKVIWNGSACGVDLHKFDINKKNIYRNKIREKLNIPDDGFVFGFVGRVTRDKGINELFEGFRDIYKTDTKAYLVIVGSNEVGNGVDLDLYQWSLDNPRVIYVGFTNEVEKFLSAMDCFVLPSYHEGFGMSIVEAEAMGVPVIATDIPGPVDAMIDGKTGILIQKQNVLELIKAMNEFMANRERVERCGREAAQFVRCNFEQNELFRYILEDRRMLIEY